mmetsp:Transcript_9518/g.28765  ORF Transcript_9518/g.28765 Transcript_9518/m.28765 type:complete len:494 (-) Transcript_9518:3-1484(-)
MGGSILAEEDRVVRHDVDDLCLGEGGHSHGSPHVVGEDEEGCAVRDEVGTVEGDAVADGPHAVFTDSKPQVAPLGGGLLEVAKALQDGQVGGREVGRASPKVRQDRCEDVECLVGELACGGLALLLAHLLEGLLPAVWKLLLQVNVLKLLAELGVLLLVLGKVLVPLLLDLCAVVSLAVAVFLDVLRDDKLVVLPAEVVAGGLHLLRAERGSVDGVRVGLVRRPVADDGRHLEQRGLVGDGLGLLDGVLDGLEVGVAVDDVDDVPAVRLEALRDVLGEGNLGVSVDRDVVVVVEGDQLSKADVSGEGCGLARDAFHQAPVAHDGVGVVVDDRRVRLVVDGSHVLLSYGEADCVADALSERSGGHLHSGGLKVLRMSRGDRSQLTEPLDVFHRHRLVSKQVHERVLQHGAMSSREDEPVPVIKVGVLRVVPHDLVEQDERGRRHAHGHARVSRVRPLDGVDREEANGVDHLVGKVVTGLHEPVRCNRLGNHLQR